MSDLIPFIQSEELQEIKAELQGKKVSIIFDGMHTRLGEALVVILRFVDGFVIKQCLVRFFNPHQVSRRRGNIEGVDKCSLR